MVQRSRIYCGGGRRLSLLPPPHVQAPYVIFTCVVEQPVYFTFYCHMRTYKQQSCANASIKCILRVGESSVWMIQRACSITYRMYCTSHTPCTLCWLQAVPSLQYLPLRLEPTQNKPDLPSLIGALDLVLVFSPGRSQGFRYRSVWPLSRQFCVSTRYMSMFTNVPPPSYSEPSFLFYWRSATSWTQGLVVKVERDMPHWVCLYPLLWFILNGMWQYIRAKFRFFF